LDELFNYIKAGRLAETAVLLLAAQEQIRMGTSCKRNGNSKPDVFATICDRIMDNNITLESEKSQQAKARIKLNHTTMTLVRVISRAGESLDSYIKKHIEVSYCRWLQLQILYFICFTKIAFIVIVSVRLFCTN
jgi:hypothetical protein